MFATVVGEARPTVLASVEKLPKAKPTAKPRNDTDKLIKAVNPTANPKGIAESKKI